MLLNGVTSKSLNLTCGVPRARPWGHCYLSCMLVTWLNLFSIQESACMLMTPYFIWMQVILLKGWLKWILQQQTSGLGDINLTKSKVLLFSNLRLNSHLRLRTNLDISINHVKLENVKLYKYLGIFLDEHLNIVEHVKYICSIMSKKNYILSKVRPYLTKEMALLLCKTCILPYADIGDIFF